MNLNAYCLLDVKAGAFAPPFFMHHDAQAIRAVSELGRDPSTTVGRYPSDFALCRVGSFDDQAGQLLPATPVNLGTVAGFLPAPEQPLPLFSPRPNGALMAPPADLNGEAN